MKENKVRYYSAFTDDFSESKTQDFKLSKDYKWVRKDIFSKILSGLIYFLAIILGFVYCKFVLHMKIYGKEKLKKQKGGLFIYGNHTQPVGDVVIPAFCALPKRIYTVVSTANYGIPVIGKILPYLGALPIVESISGIRELNAAMEYRLNAGHPVVIYPEAHVWEYYTDIRPFADTSFKYPVKFNCPVFSMTVTYKKSRIFKRPLMQVFVDGPFNPTGDTAKKKAAALKDTVFNIMKERAKNSDYNYIVYKEKEKTLK